jgi:hypothetical protein
MIEMKTQIYGIALATCLAAASTLAAHAEDATPPAAQTQTQSPPVSVARPSIVPKTNDKTTDKTNEKAADQPSNPTAAEAAPLRRRHLARHHYRRYAGFWTPFPIYLPHVYHSRIVWSRTSWVSF